VNRALREAYGIGICSVQEIGSFDRAPSIERPVRELPPESSNGSNGHSANGNGTRVRDRLEFDCAIWLHIPKVMPKEHFQREVEKELTGKDSGPHELIYLLFARIAIPQFIVVKVDEEETILRGRGRAMESGMQRVDGQNCPPRCERNVRIS